MMEMSDGNPGAATALATMAGSYERFDPMSAFKGWTALLWLDDKELYGSNIWVFYKDLCNEDMNKVVIIIRANQLGLMSTHEVNKHIKERGANVAWQAFADEIKSQIGEFNVQL
jgi:hypothetical protein